MQTVVLLVSLLALTSWLYLMSNLDYKSQQVRIEIVNELSQKTANLVASILLIESKGYNDFEELEPVIAEVQALLAHEEMNQPITVELAFEVNRFLATVTELKLSYGSYQNALRSFSKTGLLLKKQLLKANITESILKQSHLQESVVSYVSLIQHKQSLTLDDISFQLDSFIQVIQVGNDKVKDDALVFSREAMALLNHAAMLKEVNEALFQHRIVESSQKVITLYERDFAVAETATRHVKLGFFIGIFILLCLAFVLRLKQRQSFKELKNNTKALGFSLTMANQKQFSVDVKKGLIVLGKEYSKALGSGSKEYGMSIADWKNNIHPDDRAETLKALELSMRDGGVFEQEYRWKSQSGNWSWLRTISRIIEHDRHGMPLKMVGVSSNINERKRNEQVLRVIAECHSGGGSSETIFHSIVRELGTAKNVRLTFIATVNLDFKTVDTLAVWKDGEFDSNFSYSLIGTPCEKIVAREACFYAQGLQQLFPEDAQLKELGLESYMGVPLLNNNESVIGLLAILGDKPMTDQMLTEPLMLSLATRAAMEIERQNTDKKLLQLAHYDVLTGLPNRSLLSDRFLQAQAHNERSKSLLAVCFLDLDDFKPVNDVYGHDAGDQLLKQVARRLLDSIRGDDTVSRLGGDEFILLLGEMTTVDECEQSLCRIIEILSLPYDVVGETLSISASIGYTLTRAPSDELDVLIRQADHAMYNAKAMGKNSCSLFDMGLDRRRGEKQSKLLEIKDALVEGDLCLFYQPKINMRTGVVYGLEALIRWRHPTNGMILSRYPCTQMKLSSAWRKMQKTAKQVIQIGAITQLRKYSQPEKTRQRINKPGFHAKATVKIRQTPRKAVSLSWYGCTLTYTGMKALTWRTTR